MKTTIEVHGYEIVIEETDNGVSVTALKDGESVEDFQLEAEEGSDNSDEELSDEEVKDFDDFESEEGEEEDENETEEETEEAEEESEEESEEEDSVKLESFQSFISKRK